MANAQQAEEAPPSPSLWQWRPSVRTQRFVKGAFLFAFTLLALISMASFTDGDDRTNYLGLFGFALATFLHYSFGLGAYLFLAYTGWAGWRLLWNRSLNHWKTRLALIALILVCACVLLNLLAENWHGLGEALRGSVYTQLIHPNLSPELPDNIRYHLGGVPLYYLYLDAPEYSLRYLLGDLGTFLLFATGFLVGVLTLLNIDPINVLDQAGSWVKERKNRLDGRHLRRLWGGIVGVSKRAIPKLPKRRPPQPNSTPPFVQAPPMEALPIHTMNDEEQDQEEEFEEDEEADVEEDDALEIEELEAPPPPPPPQRRSPATAQRQLVPVRRPTPPRALPAPSAPSQRALAVSPQNYHRYTRPGNQLLTLPQKQDQTALHRGLRHQAEILEATLQSFGIEAKVGAIHCGPTITSFEVHPPVGVKVQKIKALENDLALNLKAHSIRIIAPIPGKAAVGIEVPNLCPQEVSFKEMLDSYRKLGKRFEIPVLLGKTVNGESVMSDLTKMPHCIIAGATGSGKSVCINTIVMSILMNAKPDEIRLLMVDPKKVELTPYTHLPHMIAPVITEPQGACAALNWLVKEMESRYEILKQVGARNFIAFNKRKRDVEYEASLPIPIPEKMFYIVAIIDELADLMMVANADIETPIARIAQMARAVGIHLILATQRPSREVITGLIKANFPTRICFKVASRINSQIVLDETGGETLLGNGDMLFLPPGSSTLVRCQGAFIRDEDINAVIDFICSQAPTDYLIKSFDEPDHSPFLALENFSEEALDPLYDQALQIVLDAQNASTTFLQRKLKIGYARAASIMDQLEENQVVSAADGSRARKILMQTAGGGSQPDLFDDMDE